MANPFFPQQIQSTVAITAGTVPAPVDDTIDNITYNFTTNQIFLWDGVAWVESTKPNWFNTDLVQTGNRLHNQATFSTTLANVGSIVFDRGVGLLDYFRLNATGFTVVSLGTVRLSSATSTYVWGDGAGAFLPPVGVPTHLLGTDATGNTVRILGSVTDLNFFNDDLVQDANRLHDQAGFTTQIDDVGAFMMTQVGSFVLSETLGVTNYLEFGGGQFFVTETSGNDIGTLLVQNSLLSLTSTDTVTGDTTWLQVQLGGTTRLTSQIGVAVSEVSVGVAGRVNFSSTTNLYGFGDGLGANLPPTNASPDFILALESSTGAIEKLTPAALATLLGVVVDTNFFNTDLTLTDPLRSHTLGVNDVAITGTAGSSWFTTLTDAGTTATTSYELTATPTGAPVRTIREASRILGASGRGYQRFVQPGYEQKLITGTVSGFNYTEIIDQSVTTPYSFVILQSTTKPDYTFTISDLQTTELTVVDSNQLQIDFDSTTWNTAYTASGGETYSSTVNSAGAIFTASDTVEFSLLDLGTDGTVTLNSSTGAYVLTTIPPTIAVGEPFVFRTAAGALQVNTFLDTAIKLQNSINLAREVVEIDSTDSPYSVAAGDEIILADTTGGAIIINLPTAASMITTGKSRVITVKLVSSSAGANSLTLEPSGVEQIFPIGSAAAANIVSNAAGDIGFSWTIISNGTSLFVI